jgi:hypothetical protein
MGLIGGSQYKCVPTFWNSTYIICNLPAGTGGNLLVNVIVGCCNLETGQISNFHHPPKRLSYAPPSINTISPDPLTTRGAEITIRGHNFGMASSMITMKIGQHIDTGVQWLSNTKLTADVPPGGGAGHVVFITVGEQESTSTLSYKAPVITNVSPTLGGGDLVLDGDEFGPASSSAWAIQITDTQTNQVTECVPAKRLSAYTRVKCTYSDLGVAGTCLGKNVTITISGLTSNSMLSTTKTGRNAHATATQRNQRNNLLKQQATV